MNVIILDGQLKSSLAAVRVCGKAQHEVQVGAVRKSAMARHSRYASTSFVYPDPLKHKAAFVSAIKTQALLCQEKPVVMAFSDATHTALQQAEAELAPHCHFVWQDDERFAIAFNKAATYSEAKLLGVPTITTYLLENEGEVRRRAEEFSWPMVVKPRESVSWRGESAVSGTASFAHTIEELIEQFTALKLTTGSAPLIQPLIYGEEYGVEMIVRDGTVVAELVHRRIRSMSPAGGASVVKEVVGESEVVTTMKEHAYKLAQALEWTGPMMVEWKVDADSRQPKLMEINGRWWGSLPLVVQAGLPLPLYYLALFSDATQELPQTAESGVVTRHFLGDVRHLLRVLFKRDQMRPLLYPSRRQALRDFLGTPWSTRSDVWSWRDPMPGLWEYVDVIMR